MERSVETFFRNAALHRGVLPQEVHGNFSDDVEIFSGVTGADSAGVFFKRDVKAPVQFMASRPEELPLRPLTGRVEHWRVDLGRYYDHCYLALSSASVSISRPCHVSSTRHVERSGRFSRTALSCMLHVKGYVTYHAGVAFGTDLDIR
jgi:hypothetical protein